MYKKIYLEISNNCNLDCDFCIKNKRSKKNMSEEEFVCILNKIKNHTNYLYFHVLGEPLIHPNINDFIDIASKDFKINITTNGYFINKIKDNKNIRQINISLHSFDLKYNISIDKYMDNIFNVIDNLDNTYISFRFWVENICSDEIIDLINKHYNTNIIKEEIKDNIKIKDKIFLNVSKEFIWPDFENDYYNESGSCYGLIDHIGILVDGTVVPCCLDSKGDINLGNIFKEELDDIVNKKRCINIIKGFKNNIKYELLCKKCKFLEK